jgi:hypothetical protein
VRGSPIISGGAVIASAAIRGHSSRSRRMGPNERFVTAVLTSFVRLTSTQAAKSHQRRPSCVLTADFAKVASVLITVDPRFASPK